MEYHIDRSLRLKTVEQIETKTLYQWAIVEVDESGKDVGHDHIPWQWTLYFTATSVTLSDSVYVREPGSDIIGAVEEERRVEQVIRMKLRPGDARRAPWPARSFDRVPEYRMLGVDRVVEDFQLEIRPTKATDEHESARAWGCVSYSAEADFRTETEPDMVIFYLFVRPETFAKYAAKLSMASVDEIVLSVGHVSGMYSEWSPSISTRSVKILTTGDEQKVATNGIDFQPPRIGEVGELQLFINRKLQLGTSASNEEDDDERFGTVRVDERAAPSNAPDLVSLLEPLKKSARWIIGLLIVLVLAVLFKQ